MEDDKISGGRVTRSLRKRMASVDSETSSRPGTPIGIKLASINEVIKSDSPSLSSVKTRRNSVTGTPAKTPSKSTALKRIGTPDPINSPMRRSTRRRSVSISEDDPHLQTPKSKPQLNALTEEDSDQLVKKPLLRSSLKSHFEPTENGKPKESSPKLLTAAINNSYQEEKLQTESINSDSRDAHNNISDIEVIIGSSDEAEQEKKIINYQKSKEEVFEIIDESDSQNSLITKTSKNLTGDDDIKIAEERLQTKEKVSTKESMEVCKEDGNETKNKESMEVNNKASEEIIKDGKNNSANLNPKKSFENASTSISKTNKSGNNQKSDVIVRLKRLSASEEKNSPLKENTNESENLKAVTFDESDKEKESSITYPRTPGVSKIKSYIDENSLNDGKKKLSFHEETQLTPHFGDKDTQNFADNSKKAVVEENYSNCQELPEKSTLMGELKISTSQSCDVDEGITPKPRSNISNAIPLGFNVDKEMSLRKEELLLSPEKLLRSGKVYGNSPPTNTINNTPKSRSNTPVSEINAPKNNGSAKTSADSSPTKTTKSTPKSRSNTPVSEMNAPKNNGSAKTSANSPPINTTKSTPKRRSITPVSEINSPKNNESIKISGNSSSTNTMNGTPKKGSTIPVKELNSSKNNESFKISENSPRPNTIDVKTHVPEINSPKNNESVPISTNSTPTNIINGTPKRRSTTSVSELISPNNKEYVKISGKSPPASTTPIKKYLSKNNESVKKSGNSPPTKLINATPKKGNTTPESEANLSTNNDPVSKTVKQKPCTTDALTDKESYKKERSFVTSWSINVSGKADESTKIDVIDKIDYATENRTTINIPDESNDSTKNKHSRYESDDNEDDVATDDFDVNIVQRTESEDDEEIVELAEGEKPYTKHPFVEDEAMEVDDNYESGDSLDSEERQEIEENEIHIDGESIGSEDTEEEIDDNLEDDDDSFITNDSVVSVLNYSDDDEHIETVQNKKKNYKRILAVDSDDSNSEENGGETITSVKNDKECEALVFEITKMIDDDDSILNDQSYAENKESHVAIPVSTDHVEAPSSNENNLNTLNDNSNQNMEEVNDVNQTILNSNEIVNESKESSRYFLSKAETAKKYEDCRGFDSTTFGKEEDTNRFSNTNRKSLNKSKQTETDSLSSSMIFTKKDIHSNSKDVTDTECVNPIQSNNFSSNNSKLSNSGKQTLELNNSVSTSGNNTDFENEANQQDRSASKKKIVKNLNQSDYLNKTLPEINNDHQEISTKHSKSDSDISKNSRRVSLKKTPNSTSFEKIFCESKSTSSTNGNETDDSSKGETNSSNRLKSNEQYNFGKSTNENTLRYETDSDEEEVKATSIALPTKAKKRKGKQNTSSDKSSALGEISTDESEDISKEEAASDLEICCVQQKSTKLNKLSTSFECLKQEKKHNTMKRNTLHSSFKYMKSNEKEQNEYEVEETNENDRSSSSSNTEDQLSPEEVEQLKILSQITTHMPKQLKKTEQRQSLGSSIQHPELLPRNKSNNKSFCVANTDTEFNPSASFIEKVAEHKQNIENQSKKRKRLSKSFSLGGSLDTDVGDQVQHLSKKSKVAQTEHVDSSTPIEKKTKNLNNIQHILGRCDEILEAANRAKLEAKQNYNKSKMRIHKIKHVKISPKATDDSEESQSQIKELKYNDERKKGQIKRAIKAAADLLIANTAENSIRECQLPHQILKSKEISKTVTNSLSDLQTPQIKNKKTEALVNVTENLKHSNVIQSSAGKILETPIQEQVSKKIHTTKIELLTGTVRIEPVTPTKQYSLSGFHENPLTPRSLGFKVSKILTAGQDMPPNMPSDVQSKKRKRNQYNYDGPKNTLPKPQWTKSGVFIEETLSSRPVKQSGSTQFLVSVLNRARKVKNPVSSEYATVPLSAANNNALQFKQNYLFRNGVPRESSHEILQRKERRRHC